MDAQHSPIADLLAQGLLLGMIPVMRDTFARTHPGVHLRAYAEPEDPLLKRLWARKIDVAVSCNLHDDLKLESAYLYRTRMDGTLAADDPLAPSPTVPAAVLVPQRLIRLDPPP